MAIELDVMQKQVKENITTLIQKENFKEAEYLLKQYKEIVKDDPDIFSMQAVLAIHNNLLDDAQKDLETGLSIYKSNFDLLYNLAYIFELKQQYQDAKRVYLQLSTGSYTVEQKQLATESLERTNKEYFVEDKAKLRITFFVKQGMDGFIGEIIQALSKQYETKKVIVTHTNQIDEEMLQADICWFEWCDELIIYGSKLELAKSKKIICRLHSYEAFAGYPTNVYWEQVDKVIFVADHIKQFVLENTSTLPEDKTIIIPNGIAVSQYRFKNNKSGFNIAYVGYINYKKGPMLLLHAFKAIHDKDRRYKLYIAGTFQDPRYVLYFKQMIEDMNLGNSVIYQGWQNKIDEWLEDKNYIISTSVLEGHPVSVMQAMAKGIKPLIHNFVGAKKIFPREYLWNTIDDCVDLITSKKYVSQEYRDFIKNKYSQERQLQNIFSIICETASENCGYEKDVNAKLDIDTIDDSNKLTNNDKKVKQYYDNFLSYLVKDRERENPRHIYLKNRLKQIVKKGDKVLDLGCGIGITSEYIHQLGAKRVLAVDLSDSLIDYARQTVANVEFRVHDITTFNTDEIFDVVVLCDCMEHVPAERYDDLFKVIRKHVKKDGIVYISIPDPEYMNLVREKQPDLLQIIDNSIYYERIQELCDQSDLHVAFYNVYSIFVGNEYNEYVLKTETFFKQQWKIIEKQGGNAEKLHQTEPIVRSEQEVKEYYNNFLSYLKQDRERENPRHTYLKNRLQQLIKPGNCVLDLGCGIGLTSECICHLGASRVLGVDLSDALIEYAKQTVKGVEFMVHDITTFNVDEVFDVVVLCDCIEHIPTERYDDLFKVIRKHVKEDGIVYTSIPDPEYMNLAREKRPDLLQIIDNSIFYREIEKLCKQSGLHVVFYNTYSVFVGNEYNEYVFRTEEEYKGKWKNIIG